MSSAKQLRYAASAAFVVLPCNTDSHGNGNGDERQDAPGGGGLASQQNPC